MNGLNNAIFVNNLTDTILEFIVTIIVVALIWIIGNWILGMVLRLATKLNIPGTKIDDKLIKKFRPLIGIIWKLVLVIVILEYIGVGSIIISAFLGAISLTIAIALGLSFGEALKPYAKTLVDKVAKGHKI